MLKLKYKIKMIYLFNYTKLTFKLFKTKEILINFKYNLLYFKQKSIYVSMRKRCTTLKEKNRN